MAIEIRTFGPDTQADAVALVNRYIAGWPYSRPIDPPLLAHWATLGEAWQPRHMLVACRGGRAVAFAHGERAAQQHNVHLVAVADGAAADAAALLGHIEAEARRNGVDRLCGPHYRSLIFYGGYVLGLEPYHPHWATGATDAFVRAAWRISHAGVLMVAALADDVNVDAAPDGYELAETDAPVEFDAQTFRYVVRHGGEDVAVCGGRVYPNLRAPGSPGSGGAVGQVGHVETREAHRRRGLARIMTQAARQRLRDMGAAVALIATGLDNHAALRAYERAGFERRHNLNEWSKVLA